MQSWALQGALGKCYLSSSRCSQLGLALKVVRHFDCIWTFHFLPFTIFLCEEVANGVVLRLVRVTSGGEAHGSGPLRAAGTSASADGAPGDPGSTL